MLVAIADLLSRPQVAALRAALEASPWVDGTVTAGAQSAKAKHNLQIPEDAPVGREGGDMILRALGAAPLFVSAAQPLRVFPPLFNRYDVGMKFDAHVDNALRHVPGAGFRIRTDLSATLFLTDPDDYDGGELVVEDTYGSHNVKLPAGHLVLYPSSSLHRVTPVTRGSRWASFFWVQSMVRDDGERALLYQFDQAIQAVRADLGDSHAAVLGLTASYHNLLRRWAVL